MSRLEAGILTPTTENTYKTRIKQRHFVANISISRKNEQKQPSTTNKSNNYLVFAGSSDHISFKGLQIRLEREPEDQTVPSGTADHEIEHAIVLYDKRKLIKATIIPSPGEYEGATFGTEPDADAAATSYANNRPGRTHDENIVYYLGVSINAAASNALSILNKYKEEKQILAKSLQRKKTIGPKDIDHAIEIVAFRRKVGEPAIAVFKDKHGVEQRAKVHVKNGHFMLSGISALTQDNTPNEEVSEDEPMTIDQQPSKAIAAKINEDNKVTNLNIRKTERSGSNKKRNEQKQRERHIPEIPIFEPKLIV